MTSWKPWLAGLIVALVACDAGAATCREQLQRFERRLAESGLAASAPERYAELARAAEEAAELRDEARCLKRVAELEAALSTEWQGAPEQDAPPPAPPAAPVLLEPAAGDAQAPSD